LSRLTAAVLYRSVRGVTEEVDDTDHEHDGGERDEQHADDHRDEVLRVLERPDRPGHAPRVFLRLFRRS
jgi:hypothetical protein